MHNSVYEEADESPGFLLWQVTNLWQKKQRAALEPLDLTHVQFVLLAGIGWLARTSSAVTQVQLAHHARTDVMMTSEVVRTLEKKGLIQRTPHPIDTRAKCLIMTSLGEDRLQQAIQIVEAVDRTFFAALSEDQSHFVTELRALLTSD
ncbi:MAG: MarR family transcriptional regulator [Ktedonobacteraceae bacterium]|nr:MarR family transcriptional regulator [Ktedonobacteraceae bacterium]